MAGTLSNDERNFLKDFLDNRFSRDDLVMILFEMGQNSGHFDTSTTPRLLPQIIAFAEQNDREAELIKIALAKRPDVSEAPTLRAMLARLNQPAAPAINRPPEPAKPTTPIMNTPTTKRFKVALSFPGEYRAYVKQIADALSATLTRERVFYDRYYEAELAQPNLDTYLQKIYHDDSELVVVVLCKEYDEKQWCGLEFRAIRDLIKQRKDKEIMFVRVANGDVKGVFGIDGYVDAKNDRPAAEIADLILQRLAHNAQTLNPQ